jgi:RTX calcium-binding nonapeptide repeat (4 copies)
MKQGIVITAFSLAAGLVMAASAAPSIQSVGLRVAATGGGAHASGGLNLGISGGPEADEISVALDSSQTQFVITSGRPVLPPGAPCVQISTFQITCPISDFISFSASLHRGNDTFRVGPSIALPGTMTGGQGQDILRGGSGPETIAGGSGADRLLGNNSPDTLRGGKGGDVLKGGKGRDLLIGGKGGDRLLGGPGRDVEKQ